MTDEHRLFLLRIIKFNGNVQPLVDLGYEFSDVVDAIKNEELIGNARIEKGSMSLTEKGNKEMNKLEKKIGRKYPWIEPEIGSRVEKLKKDEVYIPLRRSIRNLFE